MTLTNNSYFDWLWQKLVILIAFDKYWDKQASQVEAEVSKLSKLAAEEKTRIKSEWKKAEIKGDRKREDDWWEEFLIFANIYYRVSLKKSCSYCLVSSDMILYQRFYPSFSSLISFLPDSLRFLPVQRILVLLLPDSFTCGKLVRHVWSQRFISNILLCFFIFSQIQIKG